VCGGPCADLISERGVRRWGLHQTLIEARSGDRNRPVARGERAQYSPRPRNSLVPSCRLIHYERALARDQSQLGRSSGEGQPTALGPRWWRRAAGRAGTASNQRTGLRDVHTPTCSHAVRGRRRRRRCINPQSTVGLSPWLGPVRRQAQPCPSSVIRLIQGGRHGHGTTSGA
jgi:hypothetical protein